MKQAVTIYDFVNAFESSDTYKNNFTRKGLHALFEELEQYEEDMGEELDFDMIALCCEYAEYESLKEFQDDYGKEYETFENIQEETILIPVDVEYFAGSSEIKSFIIQQF